MYKLKRQLSAPSVYITDAELNNSFRLEDFEIVIVEVNCMRRKPTDYCHCVENASRPLVWN